MREDLRRLLGDCSSAAPRKAGSASRIVTSRAQPPPDAAHLQADHAGADHAQPLRHFGNRQRAGVVEDQLRCRTRAPGSARGFEPVATMTCFAVSVSASPATSTCQRSRFCPAKLPRPWKNVDLVLLEQVDDAVVVLLDDLVLALRASARGRARRPLTLMPCSAKRWPACSKFSDDCSSALDGMQPTLVQVPPSAGLPSAPRPVVDAGGLEAELRGADRGDVAAGAAADHDDVEVGHFRYRAAAAPDLPALP